MDQIFNILAGVTTPPGGTAVDQERDRGNWKKERIVYITEGLRQLECDVQRVLDERMAG